MKFFYKEPLFLVSAAIYGVNRFLLQFDVGNSFSKNYLNDCLLIPCMLPIILFFMIILKIRSANLPPTLLEVALCLFIWSVSFEYAGPAFFYKTTGDILDVWCYGLGGLSAWLFWNRKRLFQRYSCQT